MRISKKQGGAAGGILTILVALIAVFFQNAQPAPDASDRSVQPERVARRPVGGATQPPHDVSLGAPERLLRAIANRESEVMVEFEGGVTRVLADDSEGDRHQRFVVAVAGEKTVLIAHNIDLAPRVPIEVGDRVLVRGQYEWNDRGGVVHWTHHDPKGWREDGWIVHEGREYR